MRVRRHDRARALVCIVCAFAPTQAVLAQLGQPPSTSMPSIGMYNLERELQERLAARQDDFADLASRRAALGSMDGTWEGTLDVIAATPNTPERFWHAGDRPELQLLVAGDAAEVRVKTGDWRSVSVEGGFHALDLGGGGFVYAVQSANGWVENWNVSVAKKDADTLLVFLSFVAGGNRERFEALNTEFAVGGVGELKRGASSASPQMPNSAGTRAAEPGDAVFDGVWEGALELVGRYGPQGAYWLREGANQTTARLSLRGSNARLDLEGERYRTPDGFRVARHDTAVLVYATTIAVNAIGTWQLSLTMLDAETALVFAWRVGNGFDGEVSAQGLVGELKRAPSRTRRSARSEVL